MNNILIHFVIMFGFTILNSFSSPLFKGMSKICNYTTCQLPNCKCSDLQIPGDLTQKEIPQFVLISFNGAVRQEDVAPINVILNGHENPNGCPIQATFYVSHDYTDYSLVQQYFKDGHEIGVNTFTHEVLSNWSKTADDYNWKMQISNQRDAINYFANINKMEIRGMQVPQLKPGGDKQIEIMQEEGLLYDYTWATSQFSNSLWPYTLDFPSIQDCPWGSCPTKQHKGIWIVPMGYYKDKNGKNCIGLADCDFDLYSEDETYTLLHRNFHNHFKSNRSPFSISLSKSLLQYPKVIHGIERLIKKLQRMKDVYIVSTYEALNWIRHPIPLKFLNQSYLCPVYFQRKISMCHKPNKCRYVFKNQEKYLSTCNPCPKMIPTLGNPRGLNVTIFE